MSDSGKDHSSLRERAEAVLDAERDAPKGQGLEELQTALHNLRVHQIELELQNEELRLIQSELERAKTRYFQLYNSAPIGYLTLSVSGIILHSNQTFMEMVGLDNHLIRQRPFADFFGSGRP